MLFLGKCQIARSEMEAGRDKFRQVIKMGQRFDAFYLVYWGLVNIARTYLLEGHVEKALEISLILKDYPVEHKLAQDEGNLLLTDLKAGLPEWQVEAAMMRIGDEKSQGNAIADLLTHETNS